MRLLAMIFLQQVGKRGGIRLVRSVIEKDEPDPFRLAVLPQIGGHRAQRDVSRLLQRVGIGAG